jgi:hypothetical protein
MIRADQPLEQPNLFGTLDQAHLDLVTQQRQGPFQGNSIQQVVRTDDILITDPTGRVKLRRQLHQSFAVQLP